MPVIQFILQRVLGLIPFVLLLVLLGAAWHWASEFLIELRAINKHLEMIAWHLEPEK